MPSESPGEAGVFWLGGKPGTAQQADAPPEGLQYEAPIRAACSECGVAVDNFVAALGGYSSWLAEFTRTGRRHRLIWNGKDHRLSVDRALPQGGWEELIHQPLAKPGVAAFVAGARELLSLPAADQPPQQRS